MSAAPRLIEFKPLVAPGRDALRLPPQNIEAEMCTIGSMLLDNGIIDEVAAIVRPVDFFRAVHATIFRRICELHRSGVAVDGTTLADHLAKSGDFDHVGGDEAIFRILAAPPHAANAIHYARIVQEKAIAREWIGAAESILEDAYSDQFTADDLIERGQRASLDIGKSRSDAGMTDGSGAVAESMARFRSRLDGVKTGICSGFVDLDGTTGGFQPGQLIVIGARPSVGKSSLAVNMVDRLLFGADRVPVLYVSLEMPRCELGDRLILLRSGVDGYRFTHPHLLNQAERDHIESAAADVEAAPVYIDDSSARTVTQIASLARRHRASKGIGVLMVDYLQLVRGDDDSARKPRHEIVAEISCRFRALAKDLGIPVILLSQLNREVERRESKRPSMGDIRESGAVEQDANTILLLHRPEYYDPNDSPGLAELIVAKNRSGPTGIVRLSFHKPTMRFGDYVEPGVRGHAYEF